VTGRGGGGWGGSRGGSGEEVRGEGAARGEGAEVRWTTKREQMELSYFHFLSSRDDATGLK
jgi:hypothetical protein